MSETNSNPVKSVEDVKVPDEFYKIINDFIIDILTTFPEYAGIVSRWWDPTKHEKKENKENKEKECLAVFRHCVKVFPERFFDILYKNAEMFKESSEENTEFLPGIVFKMLWSYNISDTTRATIWKYLQLVLFSVIGSVHTSSDLGDTAKLFEAINEDELKNKLQETFENMQNLFDTNMNANPNGLDPENPLDPDLDPGKKINMDNMPSPEDIHEHINSMMGGKLGKLAMELAEETANDLNLDLDETKDAKDVFQKLFKNPGKMMGMVKNIGDKIDEKIKSGELKESELMSEGMDLLNKMQSMPGMGDMQKMFSQMGIPGLGKGAKMNMGAMESQLNKNMKTAKMKERMQAKAQANKSQTNKTQGKTDPVANAAISEEDIIKIFSTGEKVDRTPRGSKAPKSEAMKSEAMKSESSKAEIPFTEPKPVSKKGKKKK
jgi:hypothetical protein